MDKKILLKIIVPAVVLIAAAGAAYYGFIAPNKKDEHGCLVNKGYSWCGYSQTCASRDEPCEITVDWILGEAKKIIGLNLTTMPDQVIKWKKGEEEIAFSAKGIYYIDLTDSAGTQKINDSFNGWDNLLQDNGFEKAADISAQNEKEIRIGYSKEKNVCVLDKVNNSNNTVSVSLFCGNTGNELCVFGDDCDKQCRQDSDCGLFTDGCAKRIVCRNKSSVFYNNCANPTANVEELDTRIADCACVSNKCVPQDEKLRDVN